MENHETCQWATVNEKMQHYHDTEWGVPVHDDKKLFEFLILDSFQAGLSWNTILNKRENFSDAFDQFDWKKMTTYTLEKEQELLQNAGIIRNKLKVKAAITNARCFQEIIDEFGTFDQYIWGFVNHKPIVNKHKTMSDIPAVTKDAEIISKDLKSRGFKFVGPTIIYAFMQAAGLINDHIITCKRHQEVTRFYK